MIAVAMAFSIAGGLALTAFADTQTGGGNAQPNADYIPAMFAADAPGAHPGTHEHDGIYSLGDSLDSCGALETEYYIRDG